MLAKRSEQELDQFLSEYFKCEGPNFGLTVDTILDCIADKTSTCGISVRSFEFFKPNPFSVAAFIVMSAPAPGFAASETESGGGDAVDYAECQRLLGAEPLNELHRHVAEGRGSEIGDYDLGATLIGLKCSDEMIISFMVEQGFYHSSTRTWTEAQHGGGTVGCEYNKVISFCATPSKWIDRMIFGKCGTLANFFILDQTIMRIFAAAIK